MPAYRVGVVGLGVAGAAAAYLLAKDGHRVTLLERHPAPRPVGAGVLLHRSGQEILHHLGVLDEILTHAGRPDRRPLRPPRHLPHPHRQPLRRPAPFFQSDWGVLGWGRDLALPLRPRLPRVKRQMLMTVCGLKGGFLRWPITV